MTNIEQIELFIQDCLEGTDCFLVSFKLKPTNNYKVFIDADSGFTLEKCMKINRALRDKIDESGMYPEGDYSLEVSSPGVDVPLKQARQFRKNVGRKLEIQFVEEEKDMLEARLLAVEEDGIVVEPLGKAVKGRPQKSGEPVNILFNEIKEAVVEIEF